MERNSPPAAETVRWPLEITGRLANGAQALLDVFIEGGWAEEEDLPWIAHLSAALGDWQIWNAHNDGTTDG